MSEDSDAAQTASTTATAVTAATTTTITTTTITTTTTSPPIAASAAPLQVTKDAVLTAEVISSLFQAYTSDLHDLHLIPDHQPTRRYQWLFEQLLNRIQLVYAECEELRVRSVRNALKDLDVLVEERKRVEGGYVADMKAKDDVIEGLVKQLQGALGRRFEEAEVATETAGGGSAVVAAAPPPETSTSGPTGRV